MEAMRSEVVLRMPCANWNRVAVISTTLTRSCNGAKIKLAFNDRKHH